MAAKKRPGTVKRFDQINVIPFIDIMLVLLAIVLTTATFISQGRLDIKVPEASSKLPPPDESQVVRLGIDREGYVFYNEQLTTLEELEQHISIIEKQAAIVIHVDKDTAFQRFVQVLDLLKRHQLQRLSIITRQT